MPIEQIIEHVTNAIADHSHHVTQHAHHATDNVPSLAEIAQHAAEQAGTAHGPQFGAAGHVWEPGSSGFAYEKINGVYTGNYVKL